ncbi:MAG TPA: type IX secretion system membrane protein PorP/SprF [Bacteroidales bacterium]|nr:type IX secretion system membrane protein PorP/SprF [Bacteroidales bacterium]
MRYKIIFITFICLCSGTAYPQQVPIYSQYIMNGFLINPSLAGRDGYTTINLTVREQWLGIRESPGTYAASFQTTIIQNNFMSSTVRRRVSRPSKSSRVGLGGYLFNDNNGIIRRTGFQADYAYHIPTGRNLNGEQSDFALGLAMIAYQCALNTEKLNYSYEDDPYLTTYDKSVFLTDFNFGVSYTSKKFNVGFSMTNILRGNLVFGKNADNKTGELGHYFITAGANYPLNREWSIKPSIFLKSSDMLLKSIQMDLTTRLSYRDAYWAGLSYRTGDAIIILLGLKYDRFYFGYAYDFTLTDMRNKSIGSMELTIAGKFGESARRYRWLDSY